MPIEVARITTARTAITSCEPAMWVFFHEEDSTYSKARPVACWTDDQGDWIEAHTDVSRSTGNQYVIKALWTPSVARDSSRGEWVVKSREVIE